MRYINKFTLLSLIEEELFINYEERTCFNNFYPFRIFPNRNIEEITFDNITILYGSNGSGKSTLLNLIAEKTKALRKDKFSKGEFFDKYVDKCTMDINTKDLEEIKIITSDDVFDYLFDIRAINSHVTKNRNELFEEYIKYKYNDGNCDLSNYENLKKSYDAKKKTMSNYVRERLTTNNIIEKSNGESSHMYFEKEIKKRYILT